MGLPKHRRTDFLVAETGLRTPATLYPLACPVRRYAKPQAGAKSPARPAQAATAGQPDLAPAKPHTQFRPAGDATGRPVRQGAQPTPDRPRPARCRRRQLAHHRRRAPGDGAVVRHHQLRLHAAAGADGAGLDLGQPDQCGVWRVAMAGTSVQPDLRSAADPLGADLRRLRLHPLPESPHCSGSLGHRTGLPPATPAPDGRGLCPAAGLRPAVDAAAKHRHGLRYPNRNRKQLPAAG